MDANVPVGAVAVAFDTPGVHMLEERSDLAVLWDIRVAPEAQGRGVGRRLFEYAVEWARAHGGTQMKIETQNVNVSACRFYEHMGCELGEIRRFGFLNEMEMESRTLELLKRLTVLDRHGGPAAGVQVHH